MNATRHFHAGKYVRLRALALVFLICFIHNDLAAQELRLGPALNGGWFDPDQPGQGLLVDTTVSGDFFFAGWFTYPAPTEDEQGEHRWWTIEGPYLNAESDLTVYLTTGGGFLSDATATSVPAGTARVFFPDCDTLVLDYDLDHGEQGTATMTRLLQVPAGHCDSQIVIRELEAAIDAQTPVVFRDVTVARMTPGAPIVDPEPTNVLVSEGVIQAIDNFSALNIPNDAVILDGRGRYLMPGLVDSHTHMAVNVNEFQGFATPQSLELVATNQLQLYLANGVTTILNLGDFGEPQVTWSQQIAAGTRIGPNLYAARYARGGASSCDGGPGVVTVGSSFEDGQAYVDEAIEQGFHLIKIYNCTPPAAVDGILARAAETGISVAGHLPTQYNTNELLRNETFSLVAHSRAFVFNGFLSPVSGNVARDQAVTAMMDGNTALSSTLWIVETINQVFCNNQAGIDAWFAALPVELMHSTEHGLHRRSVTGGRFAPSGCTPNGFQSQLSFARDMARRVHDAGGLVLAGSDSPTVLGAAGFSMHDELQALRRAGFSDHATLAAATSNAGQYLVQVLPDELPIGTISRGARADLLLLDRPPADALDDFAASLEIVMARGNAYPRAVRQAWFDRIREEYNITCPPHCSP